MFLHWIGKLHLGKTSSVVGHGAYNEIVPVSVDSITTNNVGRIKPLLLNPK